MTPRFEILEDFPISITGNKAALYVNFFSSNGDESGFQYYEVDIDKFPGENNDQKIQYALQKSLDDYECQKIGVNGASES